MTATAGTVLVSAEAVVLVHASPIVVRVTTGAIWLVARRTPVDRV